MRLQREHDLGGVVDVGVDVVGELEGPAGRVEIGSLHRPVAAHADLFGEHPADAARDGRVVDRHARVEQRDDGEAGVPDRRLAGLEPADAAVRCVFVDEEAVQALDRRRDHRVVQRVAQQVQGEDRVDPRRLDAAPAAVGLLAGDDPLGGLRASRDWRSRAAPARGGRA